MPIQLWADLAELDRLTEYLEDFSVRRGLGRRDLDALTLAAEELFANSVEHGGENVRAIQVSVEDRGNSVLLRYAEDGPSFDPTAAAPPDLTLPPEQRPRGGLGLFLVGRLMQRVTYERVAGSNVITLIREVGERLPAAETNHEEPGG